MADDDRGERVPADSAEELPAQFQALLAALRTDRKRLLRTDAFGKDTGQLRAFMGQYLMPRMEEIVAMFAQLFLDSYGLALSNGSQLQRMHAYMLQNLKKLGVDVKEGDELPGVDPAMLDELQQALYGLRSLLTKLLPENPEVAEAFNRVAAIVSDIWAASTGQPVEGEYEGDDDDDDDEEDEDDADDGDDEDDDEDEEDEDDAEPEKKDAPAEEPPAKETP